MKWYWYEEVIGKAWAEQIRKLEDERIMKEFQKINKKDEQRSKDDESTTLRKQ